MLKSVIKLVDTNGDGKIQYEGALGEPQRQGKGKIGNNSGPELKPKCVI